MSVMWIANCTKFTQVFMYRLPERPQLYQLEIKALGQSALQHELPEDDLRMIAEAHAAYGLVEDKHVHNVKGYNGLIFRIGQPVDMDRIQHVQDVTQEHLQDEVQKRIEATLVAGNIAVKKMTGEDSASLAQVEIVEVVPNNRDGIRRGGAVLAGQKEVRSRSHA